MVPLGLRILWRDPGLRLTGLAILCAGTVGAAITPYQSLLAVHAFGIPPRFYSVILVLAALASVGSAVGFGILSDQYARRRQMAITLSTAMVLGSGLIRLLPSAGSFTLAHALLLPIGMALFGQLFALARILTQRRPAAERDAVSALIRAIFAIPYFVVLPLWTLALKAGLALIDVYALALIAALICLGLVLRSWPADSALPETGRSGLSFRASLAEMGHPAVLSRMIALGMMTGSISLYMILLGLIFSAPGGAGQDMVALFAGLTAGLEIPFMLMAGIALKYVSRTRVIAWGALIHAGFMLAFSQWSGLPHVLWLTLPAGIGGGILLSVPLGYIQDLMHHRPGAGGALIAINQFLGGCFAALSFYIGTQIAGYALAAIIGAGLCLTGALILSYLDSPSSALPGPAE